VGVSVKGGAAALFSNDKGKQGDGPGERIWCENSVDVLRFWGVGPRIWGEERAFEKGMKKAGGKMG